MGASPFSLAMLKKAPSLIPVVICLGIGLGMSSAYLTRIALFSPDTAIRPSRNPHPWNAYEKKNYKLVQVEPFDVKSYEHPRPRF